MKKEEIAVIETNIDDMNPEVYDYVMDKMFDLGAVDVYFTPIQMKKNRPGITLSVLVPPEKEDQVIKGMLQETTTLGVRFTHMNRVVLDREVAEIETELGVAKVKLGKMDGKTLNLAPEYQSCRELAEDEDSSLLDVYALVRREAEQEYGLR